MSRQSPRGYVSLERGLSEEKARAREIAAREMCDVRCQMSGRRASAILDMDGEDGEVGVKRGRGGARRTIRNGWGRDGMTGGARAAGVFLSFTPWFAFVRGVIRRQWGVRVRLRARFESTYNHCSLFSV